MIYTFNEPGSIPGIPGTFANCRVTVDDSDGHVVAIGPLHGDFTPSLISVDAEAPIAEVLSASPEQEASPIVPEQDPGPTGLSLNLNS